MLVDIPSGTTRNGKSPGTSHTSYPYRHRTSDGCSFETDSRAKPYLIIKYFNGPVLLAMKGLSAARNSLPPESPQIHTRPLGIRPPTNAGAVSSDAEIWLLIHHHVYGLFSVTYQAGTGKFFLFYFERAKPSQWMCSTTQLLGLKPQ